MDFNSIGNLLWSAVTTLKISGLAILLGATVGILMGLFSSQKMKIPVLDKIIRVYVAIMRGVPLFIQLLLIYFGIPEITKVNLTPFTAGVIALGCHSAAYLAEIIRGGLNALRKEQWDAAFCLGYTKLQTTCYIILPQLFRNTLPAMTNEFVALIKDSSILMILGVQELTKVSKDIVSRELRPFEIYGFTALIYFAMTAAISGMAKKFERHSS